MMFYVYNKSSPDSSEIPLFFRTKLALILVNPETFRIVALLQEFALGECEWMKGPAQIGIH